MAHVRTCVAAACAAAALGLTTTAGAALIDRGGGLVYDTELDVTWLADANLGAGTAWDDGFSTTDGLMTWQSAVAWAEALEYYDSVRGITLTQWRLPSTVQPDPTCSQQEGGGQFSAGANCTGSELGHLFYDELGGTALSPISGSSDPDLALFTNVRDDGYWSGTEFDATFAWVLHFGYGLQAADNKTLGYSAWAVFDGDVAAIPAPGAAWLLGTGLLALLGRSRRRPRA